MSGNAQPDKSKQQLVPDFKEDTKIICDQTNKFLRLVYPGYLIDKDKLKEYFEKDSTPILDVMTYFRISCCTVDTVDNLFETINAKIEKLFTAFHSIGVSIGYGLISYGGTTNLVLAVYSSSDVEIVKSITLGMLTGVELNEITPNFSSRQETTLSYGLLSGVPSLFLNEQKQTFSLSSIMRSLNGQNYTLLFLAKPVSNQIVNKNIDELIKIKDKCFAISKHNIARSRSYSETNTHADNVNDTNNKGSIAGGVGSGLGPVIGVGAGAILGQILIPVPGVGAGIGAGIGGAVGGGLGTVIGTAIGGGKSSSHSEGYSDAISKAITKGGTVSCDIQNGFALELMNYTDKAIVRLKGGQNNGVWQTAIAYSAESDTAKEIIQACLCGELSKPDPDKLPLLPFDPGNNGYGILCIPNFMYSDCQNPLCSYINSSELGLLCTVPTESVPDFELRIEKTFPMLKGNAADGTAIKIGNVTDGKRELPNMPFAFSKSDLNKHTFVCGITGSGKTTTVKKILTEAKIPFLVIESAKKEYRNTNLETTVYTVGKPEINCPQINPFYITPGVSPQSHIDFLKDLFNASFSFYGPMPYILEKCLHNVYRNKGWNLTSGYHPMLVNMNSVVDFFDLSELKKKYALASHKYVFPTMQELKDEIERYIREELNYHSEIAENIKTAIRVRLENLCVGTKGHIFNTCEFPDFEKLLKENVIFELEGLADDSDKAFCVGLLVIFINEYRQVMKEIMGSKQPELEHLLVIEEAHRLLKNIETERSSENMGNPKGKAVEHFTNMIAEMRSYGQGVIIAEQIPSKLAPDVIKNSSNKIIHRIVSADDQQLIANTVGLKQEASLQFGTLEEGYSFCHREGMALPVSVKITWVDDIYVSDEILYNKYNTNNERINNINICSVRDALYKSSGIKQPVLKLINTILVEDSETAVKACEYITNKCVRFLRQEDVEIVFNDSPETLCAKVLSEIFIGFLIHGVYKVNMLPPDDFLQLLENFIAIPSVDKHVVLKSFFEGMYGEKTEDYAKRNVAELIRRKATSKTNIQGTIDEYFINVTPETKNDILSLITEFNQRSQL